VYSVHVVIQATLESLAESESFVKLVSMALRGRLRAFGGAEVSIRRQLVSAAAGSLVLALSSKLLVLLTSVLLARWMGAEGYGLYATAMALAMLLTAPTGLGLPTLMVRLLASYRVHQQWGMMRGLLTRGNQAVLAASLLMAVSAGAMVWWYAARLMPEKALTFGVAVILIPLSALGVMRSAALRGLHHVILGQLPESVIMPTLFLGLVGSWWLIDGGAGKLAPQMAVTARVIATGAAFFVGSILLIRRIPDAVRQAIPQYELRAWGRSALPLLFIAGINIINTQTDVLMLAGLRGSESAGVYQAAARGAELVAFSLVIVNMAIQPSLARLFASSDRVRLQRVATIGARAATAVALPVASVMIFWSGSIMASVFGQAFERGAVALVILSGAQLVNAATGPASEMLKMTGHEQDTLKGMIVGVLVNVVLNYFLIPPWDIAGAAIATGTSLVVWNLLLVVQVWRRLKLNATAVGSSSFGNLIAYS
jgi:O-antigen/teichoic acid export membrane protein